MSIFSLRTLRNGEGLYADDNHPGAVNSHSHELSLSNLFLKRAIFSINVQYQRSDPVEDACGLHLSRLGVNKRDASLESRTGVYNMSTTTGENGAGERSGEAKTEQKCQFVKENVSETLISEF